MTEEEINEWFEEGRGVRLQFQAGYFEVEVYDLSVDYEGRGEGDTYTEALSDAIIDFQRYSSGAI